MPDEKPISESLPDTMTWEILNAYVDQELDPRRAALVADAVARDHGLAARVATLSKLRATAREMPPASHAPPPLALRTFAGFWSLRVMAVAASILLAVVLGSTLLWRGPAGEMHPETRPMLSISNGFPISPSLRKTLLSSSLWLRDLWEHCPTCPPRTSDWCFCRRNQWWRAMGSLAVTLALTDAGSVYRSRRRAGATRLSGRAGSRAACSFAPGGLTGRSTRS